ncbi:MAG: thioredoxin family protein [Desulfomonile sp.]|nr:thioredoxin family protein [Desulfomonile sp.]
MLSDSDLLKVQTSTADLTEPVTILVSNPGSDKAFDRNLVNVARQISGVSWGRVMIEEDTPSVFENKTSITLSGGDTRNIQYLAAPEGMELPPFLDAIAWLGKSLPIPDSDVLRRLDALTEPVRILAFVAPACPHCPEVVRKLLSTAVCAPSLTVTVVDAVEHGDLAERYKVKATPTVIFNEAATLVGRITDAQIVDEALRGSAQAPLTAVIESMIAAGRAEDAAELMVREGQTRAILPIYQSSELAHRIGALVAMEEALTVDARSLDPILDELCALLAHEDARLRGDTADILGKIGNRRAVPALRKLVDDPDPDVAEAASEALELLER